MIAAFSFASIGLPLIDDGHRRVDELAEALVGAIAAGRGGDVVEALALRLMVQMTNHFAAELSVMNAAEFPGFEVHAEEHDALLQHVRDLLASQRAGTAQRTRELASSIKPTLAQHARQCDQRLAAYLGRAG